MADQNLIDHLNEILKHEWTGVAQYSQASFIIEGVWREVYAEKFIGDAKESFGHAQQVADKIVALGGVPVATRNEIQQSRDLQEVFTFSLAFESKAVEMYSKAIEMAGQSAPGPDGIPYIAWRLSGDIALETFYDAATALQSNSATNYPLTGYAR